MRKVIQYLLSWGLGQDLGPGAPGRTIFLDSVDRVSTLLDSGLYANDTVVFAPAEDNDSEMNPHLSEIQGTGHPVLVRYRGSLSNLGDELSIGDFTIEAQQYATIDFLTIAGPTLVRISGEDDFGVFLRDADLAKEEGIFSPFLTHPMTQLADLCALGGTHACSGPDRRLTVDTLGAARTGPFGLTIGTAGDSLDTLTDNYWAWRSRLRTPGSGCPVCLGEVLANSVQFSGHAQRPWLSRYLYALDALRMARARGFTGLNVSGFAHRLCPNLEHDDRTALDYSASHTKSPLLLFNDVDALLYDPSHMKQFKLGGDSARIAEMILTCGVKDAAIPASKLFGLGHKRALSLVEETADQLGRAGVFPSSRHT